MATYKNTAFKTRNYECTNVVFAQAETKPTKGDWQEVSESEIAKLRCEQLYKQAGITYYGYL